MIHPSDERLRAAYSAVLETRAPRTRESCASPEALLDVVDRRGSEETRLATLDHVMSCATCRRELDLVRAAAAASEGTLSRRHISRGFPTRWMAIAATVVIVAGIGLVYRLQDREAPFVPRGGEAMSLHGATRTSTGDARLAWRPALGATGYDVTILDESGRELVNRRIADTTVVVADSLVAGSTGFVVSVTAVLSDGTMEGPVSSRVAVPPR
jgi:hypothetical protein